MNAPILILCENERKAETYTLALNACGVESERVRVLTPQNADPEDPEITELATSSAGLILTGGPDIEPSRYGEEPIEEARLSLVPQLDELEWAVLDGAHAARTPVWAICRGMQVLNVFLGGSLWQDLPLQMPAVMEHDVPRPRDALAHPIRIVADTHPLSDRLAEETVLVNTRHHQAVRRVAEGLRVLGVAADGVIEVMCGAGDSGEDWWIYGVQWHPENLIALPIQMRLWKDFVEASEEHAKRRSVES